MLRKVLTKGSVGWKHIWNVKERDSTGKLVALDLTGFTGKIFIYSLDRTTFLLNGSALNMDAPVNGAVSYTLEVASSATIGLYLAKLEFKQGTAQTIYTKEFEWQVEDVKTA